MRNLRAGAFGVRNLRCVGIAAIVPVAALLAHASGALAQTTTVSVPGMGAVTGTVKTADGAGVPTATVTLIGSGTHRTLRVGTSGGFVATGIPAGTYVIRASARGSNTLSGRTIDVIAGQATNLDFVLAGSASSLATIGQVLANQGGISTSSAPASTINSQSYAALGYTLLSDVLQNDISTSLVHPLGGGLALPTSVALRGPDPTETLVDIDGHQVNNGNTGDFDLSLLDPADYSTVELLKGISPSSLVGPDTIDGAINIRTLDPTSQPHGLLRLSAGSFGAFGETIQATGTADQRLGYAVSLHRTTTNGEVNQSVLDASSGDVQQVGSAVDGSTMLAKLRYAFGRGDGFVELSVRDQSQYRDLSAALTSIVPPGGSSAPGDALVRGARDDVSAALPLVDSFSGTSLLAHNSGYGLDAHIPLGGPDISGNSTTYAVARHYTDFVGQSIFGPGADTSPYLYNDRDLVTDNSIEIDHLFPEGALSLQYGIRNENLNTDFVPGVVNEESVSRRPLDDGTGPSQARPTAVDIVLGQTQRTVALRYIGDVSPKLHLAAAAYYSQYSSFGTSLDPRFGLTWTPNAGSAVRASVGTTFQAPQLPELLVPPVLPPPVGGYISVGNPSLQPDRATAYSLGYERILTSGPQSTDVTADFYLVNLRTPASTYLPAPGNPNTCGSPSGSSVVRMPGSEPVPLAAAPACPLSYPVNAGNGGYQGLEIQATRPVAAYTTVRAGWAVRSAYLTEVPPYIEDGTLVVGEQDLGLPLHKATLFVDHNPPQGFGYGAGLVYEGAYNELNQPPFTVLNANLGYRFKQYELAVAGTNLTNVYDQRFTRDGAGVLYGGLDQVIPTDAYALQGTAFTVLVTRRF